MCYDLPSQFSAGAKCIGRHVGQLQPYALYVPKKSQPGGGWGMTLLLQFYVQPAMWWTAHVYWVSILAVLICGGPGGISVDAVIRWIHRRK